MLVFVFDYFLLFAEEFRPRNDSPKRNQNYEQNRGNPEKALWFRLEPHWFVDQVLLRTSSDIRRLRLFHGRAASFRRPVLRDRHLNCPHSGHAESSRSASLAYRT